MAHHFALHGAGIDAREVFLDAAFEQRTVRDFAKIFRDEPDIFFCGCPVKTIEPGQVYRARIPPERALAAQIEVGIEIAQGQLAQGAVNRLSITAPGEIGFGDGAPVPARFENRDNVVGVVIRLEIPNERRKSEHAQSCRREDCALEAMRCFFAEHHARRPGRSRQVVRNVVEVMLDAGRRLQCT